MCSLNKFEDIFFLKGNVKFSKQRQVLVFERPALVMFLLMIASNCE
jgi:hypothetical protein